jgi:hypothetical protein
MHDIVTVLRCVCDKCGHKWLSETIPERCTSKKCRTPYWDRPRTSGLVTSVTKKRAPGKKWTTLEAKDLDGHCAICNRSETEAEMHSSGLINRTTGNPILNCVDEDRCVDAAQERGIY